MTTRTTAPPLFWAPLAWLPTPDGSGQWQRGVCLEVDALGHWAAITAGVATAPAQATVLAGAVLPGMVNAHSHAFQRAFAGLSERRVARPHSDATASGTADDDFWSWRDRMYAVALRITPAQMRAVAAQLYAEMLQGGYTQVCEFHYLHHSEDGTPYTDPATMCWSLADAAADSGIGSTLLPVLYQRAGFAHSSLRHDQRRFASDAQLIHTLQQTINQAQRHPTQRRQVQAGVAIHSLRAASPDMINALLAQVADADIPIHIHIAEQIGEVNDCLAHTCQRPIDWLCSHTRLDQRWQLVHATHALRTEIEAVAHSGAGLVLCPSTEANLGDGLTDVAAWLGAGVPMAIGSDSQVCRNWAEELRWLEYGQRLQQQKRNICATQAIAVSPTANPSHATTAPSTNPHSTHSATAARLFDATLAAGGSAAGHAQWGLVKGARADAVVLNVHTNGLLGVPESHLLDATIFACDTPSIGEVYVAGQRVVQDGKHIHAQRIVDNFVQAMGELWG